MAALRRFLAIALFWPLGAMAQDFPQTFTHMYGETTVMAVPERVVSLGFVGHDNILALGVTPVALRHWYGDFPNSVWPWAAGALGDATPVVLRGEVALEQVAAAAPDVIIAIGSGITASEYAILSQIAPTIASEAAYGDYLTPWDVQALTIGRALGKQALAEELVTGVKQKMAAIRTAHPDWQGKTAAAAYIWSGGPGAFLDGDTRVGVLHDLGFITPPALTTLTGPDSFFANISPEDLAPLEADLLVWIGSQADTSALSGLSLRNGMRAHREGREVYADLMLAGAMSHGTLLSLPYALDLLVPQVEAAMDGDPATPVPSAVAAGLAP